MEIQQSTKYRQFKRIKGNRVLNPNHIARLKKSIERKNLLHLNPIIVNERHEIIDDTQHIPTLKCQYSAQPNEPTKTDILKLSKAEVEEVKTLITECETLFQ